MRLHIENTRALGRVFEADEERVATALGRHPTLAGRVTVTIGYDGEDFGQHIATANALLAWNFDRSRLAERAPSLRWIHANGAGVNHLLPLDWLPPGAVLTNSRGVHGAKADEYTLMAILMLNNRLPESVTYQRAARWQQVFTTSVTGKVLLIIGVGHVGGGAAKWAKRLGLHVIGVRRTGKAHRHVDEMYGPGALQSLLPRADFVLVTAPSTRDTHHLIGAPEIALLKQGAGIVNYSRANLVDYDALRVRLERDELCAVLDVFDPEPLPGDSPLWTTRNLIITPHSASDDSDQYTPKTLDLVFRNLERFIGGKKLLNRVDPHYQY